MEYIMVFVIRQEGIVQNVDGNALLQLLVLLAFLKLAGIPLAPVEQRPLLDIVFVEQLHLNVYQLALSGLRIYIEDGLLVKRIVLVSVGIHQDNLCEWRFPRFGEYPVQKSQQHILIVLAAKDSFEYKIHSRIKQFHIGQLHSLGLL
ncbi:hypothetical protein D3C72_1908200 [compost metagenome]